MLKAKTRWESKTVDDVAVQALAKKMNIDPLVVSLCWLRGLRNEVDIQQFLHPALQQMHDPFLLKGMKESVQRIRQAITQQEKILIYGDYDADGVTSTTIMIRLLQQLGANFDYTIPDRFRDGYGLNVAAIERAKEQGFSLIVTVDTGIAAVAEVELAHQLGIDVIISDHHEPPALLPNAYAIINPKQPGCPYPFDSLSGAGVALKLTQAMLETVPEEVFALAAIGTIADLVPLLDENRIIAIQGLQALKHTSNDGFNALFAVSGIVSNEIDAAQVGFALGPRINAAGRLAHANTAVQLLISDNAMEAEQYAKQLQALNQQRQALVRTISVEAEQQAEELIQAGMDAVIVVAGEEWHEGVIGIVASKLVEKYYRPTIVLSIDPQTGIAKGSARSIDGFDLYVQLTACKDLLLKFGGHTMAAGLSMEREKIDALRTQLNALGKAILTEELLLPKTNVELTCNIQDITLAFCEQLAMLAPYGEGNPEPKIMLRNTQIVSQRKVGGNGDHLKWVLRHGDAQIDAIGFGFGAIDAFVSPQASVHVVAEVGINEWNGTRKAQLFVRDCAIDTQQIFDYRGKNDRDTFIAQFDFVSKPLLLYFRPENEALLHSDSIQRKFQVIRATDASDPTVLAEVSSSMEMTESITDVVLYDLPTSYATLQALHVLKHAERIWLLFGTEMNQQGLSKIPNREAFVWLYSYLRQNKRLALDDKIWEIVKWKRISEQEIRFMVQVFLELAFVYEDDGVFHLVESPQKRSFEQSITYQTVRERIDVERELLFSSVEEISKWFTERT